MVLAGLIEDGQLIIIILRDEKELVGGHGNQKMDEQLGTAGTENGADTKVDRPGQLAKGLVLPCLRATVEGLIVPCKQPLNTVPP